MTDTQDPRYRLAQEALEWAGPKPVFSNAESGAVAIARDLAQALIEVLGEKDAKDEEIAMLRFAAENAHREHEEMQAENERLRAGLDQKNIHEQALVNETKRLRLAVRDFWVYIDGAPILAFRPEGDQ